MRIRNSSISRRVENITTALTWNMSKGCGATAMRDVLGHPTTESKMQCEEQGSLQLPQQAIYGHWRLQRGSISELPHSSQKPKSIVPPFS